MKNFIKSVFKDIIFVFKYKKKKKKEIFYKKFINHGDLVFDVGANIGNRVITFLELKADVLAVEPNLDCIKILKKKFGNKIKYENVGLAAQKGELDFHISNVNTLSTFSEKFIKSTTESGRFSGYTWEKVSKIEVKTLDCLIEKYGTPKFVKIDTEGFDEQVIKGLSKKVSFISFEYVIPELKEELLRTIEHVIKLGDIDINVSIGESMELHLDEWISGNAFYESIKNESGLYKDMQDFGDVYIAMK